MVLAVTDTTFIFIFYDPTQNIYIIKREGKQSYTPLEVTRRCPLVHRVDVGRKEVKALLS